MGNIRDEYEDLMNMDSIINSAILGKINHNSYNDIEDEEDFVTSKEIAKMEEIRRNEDDGSGPPKKPVEIEEVMQFQRYTKQYEHKYTKSEMDAIIESCKVSIVHDYGENDYFHMSDEERARIDSLNELRPKLGAVKRIYHNVAGYIEAMRLIVKAWTMLEESDNFIHSKDEFFQMVAEGKIYNSSLIMPKLKGMSKYNIHEIGKYISNPELDPNDLLTEEQKKKLNNTQWYDEQFEDYTYECTLCHEEIMYSDNEEIDIIILKEHIKDKHPELLNEFEGIEELPVNEAMKIISKYFKSYEEKEMQRLLSEEEVQYLLDNIDNPPAIEVKPVKKSYIKEYRRSNNIFNRRNKKKKGKKKQAIADTYSEIFNAIERNPENRDDDYSYNRSMLLTDSIFDVAKKEKSVLDKIKFRGSWTSKTDLMLYDMVLEEALMNEHPEESKYQTYGDLQLNEFFRTMEEAGLNVMELRRSMNMTQDDLQKHERKRATKSNKKKENAVLQRIIKLNNNPKFKKLISKAEKQINNQIEYE